MALFLFSQFTPLYEHNPDFTTAVPNYHRIPQKFEKGGKTVPYLVEIILQ